MPIYYKSRDRKRLALINLEKLKSKLIDAGYKFIREGNISPDDEPSKWCNYLFYKHPTNKEKQFLRIGYNIFNFTIFEIAYVKLNNWWDILPDFRKKFWKHVKYEKIN